MKAGRGNEGLKERKHEQMKIEQWENEGMEQKDVGNGRRVVRGDSPVYVDAIYSQEQGKFVRTRTSFATNYRNTWRAHTLEMSSILT